MKRSLPAFFLIAVILYCLDQATKAVVVNRLHLYQVVPVMPFFNLVYYHNTGSAFGMFRGLGNLFFIVVSVAAAVGVSVMMIRDTKNRLGLALILGGAAGNLTDRVMRGAVVDFLEVYAGRFYWPAFNVADAALTVGILLLTFTAILEARRPR